MTCKELEDNLRKIYKRQWIRTAACLSLFVMIIVGLGVLMMTLGNTNYSLKEVMQYLFSDETKGGAYTIKTLRLSKSS